MDTTQPPRLVRPEKRHLALFLKLASIGGLIVLLHIPLMMTHGVLVEREKFQAQATEEIAGIWGRQQVLTGPVLAIPYNYRTQVIRSRVVGGRAVQVEETELAGAMAYFLPETLAVTGDVVPEIRHRGIYDTVVYSTKLRLVGAFHPDFVTAGIEADEVDWAKAQVMIGVGDLHGVRSVGPLNGSGQSAAPFESTDSSTSALLALAAKIRATAGQDLEFNFDVAMQGSERLEVAPVGKVTTVMLQSPWADPSFVGAALPMTRQVSRDGFKAEWQATHFSRGFPQSWSTRVATNDEMTKKILAARFGVRFAQPSTGYGMVERAQKYGVLFFVLVFAVFFLFEVTGGLKIHPLQYLLVGAALCLFFLGFLALSEFLETALAYTLAALACTLLVALYAWSLLRTGWRTLIIGGGLGATYAYLYFVLKSEDYALVAGTAALFAALGLLMWCTRRINWYDLELTGTPNAGEAR
jgi:inner membrane protein